MKTIAASTENVAVLKNRIAELEMLVKFYKGQFRLAKHRQFGASSEKSEYDQLNIFNEAETTADANVPEPELTEIKRHFRKRNRLINEKLPDDLSVEVVEHDLPSEEWVCLFIGRSKIGIGRE